MKKKIATALALVALASPALSEGDAEAGKKHFRKCAACHATEEGKRKLGPTLFQIIGREAATLDGFKFSKAMKDSGLVWDEDTLAEFLVNPRALVPGTKMAFRGVKKTSDIADLIAFLKTLQ